jgi:hypothetical protein
MVVLVMVAASPVAAQSIQDDPRDIPYFETHHAERRAMLERCQRDVRLARMPVCQNAELAGAAQMGRPLPPLPPEWGYPPSWRRQSAPPAPLVPIVKGSARAT